MMRVALVGCGRIGERRARALSGCRLVVCCDPIRERAEALARISAGAEICQDWQCAVRRPDVDIVLIATTHNCLAPIAGAAASAGKHVLIEKPGATRSADLLPVMVAARTSGVCVRVGFNHRYHRAIQKARELFVGGAIGPLMFVRGRYGHGGRVGYEKEWRAHPELSGGGELLDQGVHLIDLARWFAGDFTEVKAYTATLFWDMPVDDNAFLLLRTGSGQIASLHATWTEWKNLFSFEIYGRVGKLEVSGLGGSYGVERITHYAMSAEMGPPKSTTWEYPMADNSWDLEFATFLEDIRLRRAPSPGMADAIAALEIVEKAYRSR
jgi:predicted dehydrogenase